MKKYKAIAWGVWDGLHQGHLNLLKKASKECELIVGVSTDDYVKEKKGVKTMFNYEHRKELLESLKFINKVIPQSKTYTKKKAVKKYKPDYIFVGDDWKNKHWEGEKLGIPVKYIKYTEGVSSTDLRKDSLVSIVIPVWGKYKKYLDQCIEAVNKQTYRNYEIIVVDNKTDLPSARNKGIKKAKGEYILPLDVDDTIEPDYLAKTLEKKADIITTACNLNGKKWLPASEITLEEIKKTNIVIACSLFKKEVWEKVGGYDEEMKTGLEDWDFWLRAMKKGYKIEVIDEPLYNYNKREDGQIATMKNKDNAISHLRAKHIKYSVIIPTMWASDKIQKMIKVYDKSPYISEVLIINNKPEDSLKLKSKKVKEIYKGENIYVNPAWNLGVREAKEENIIIANDDVYFNNLNELLNRINLRDKMIVAPDLTSFREIKKDNGKIIKIDRYLGKIKIEETSQMTLGYGTFMIMKKSAYQVVPSHLLIWEGDTLQFQANDSYTFKGIDIETEMSETIKKFNLKDKAKEDLKGGKISKIKLNSDLSKITFIIKTFKRYSHLKELLISIRKFYPDNKVIISDDNKPSEFKHLFYQRWKNRLNIELIRLPFNSGLSMGRNKMVELVKTPYTLLLEDDFVFTEETDISKFKTLIESEPKVGVVGGMCLEGRFKIEQHYEFIPELKNGVLIHKFDGDNYFEVKGIKAKQTGCVLNFGLFKTQLLKEIKWDDELKLSEHLDFYLRLNKTDWKILYTPQVKIIHNRGGEGDYREYRQMSKIFQIKMYKKNKINKIISINGLVGELIGDTIKRYRTLL